MHGECHFLGLPYAQHNNLQCHMPSFRKLNCKSAFISFFTYPTNVDGLSSISTMKNLLTCIFLYCIHQVFSVSPIYSDFRNPLCSICKCSDLCLKMVGILCYHCCKDHALYLLINVLLEGKLIFIQLQKCMCVLCP